MILRAFSVIVNLEMGKKRKTRREKIILQLKRQLAQFEPSQEAIPKAENFEPEKIPTIKKPDISILSFDPKLIRKDLLKTTILSLIVFILEIVLYLKLR